MLAPEADVPVLDVRELAGYIEREKIRVAILSVSEQAASGEMERLRQAGIEGVLNFTATQLRSSPGCIVHSINIRMEIEKLFYLVHFTRHDETEDATDPVGPALEALVP